MNFHNEIFKRKQIFHWKSLGHQKAYPFIPFFSDQTEAHLFYAFGVSKFNQFADFRQNTPIDRIITAIVSTENRKKRAKTPFQIARVAQRHLRFVVKRQAACEKFRRHFKSLFWIQNQAEKMLSRDVLGKYTNWRISCFPLFYFGNVFSLKSGFSYLRFSIFDMT